MDRGVLVQGFLKIFIPLIAGSITGAIVGTAYYTTLRTVVLPIIIWWARFLAAKESMRRKLNGGHWRGLPALE
jgi:hypothetical protein